MLCVRSQVVARARHPSAYNRACLPFTLEKSKHLINVRSGRLKHTPLHYAIRSHNVRHVELLLGVDGIDANCLDKENLTPLDAALHMSSSEMVFFLARHAKTEITEDIICNVINQRNLNGLVSLLYQRYGIIPPGGEKWI